MNIWKELHRILETHDTVDCSMLGYVSWCAETEKSIITYHKQIQALQNDLVIVASNHRTSTYTLQKKGTVPAYYHGPHGVVMRVIGE